MSVRSQYPAAQSRPQRPDWRVSLTTQERPRRPSSLGSRAEPSRMGRLAAPTGSLRAPQGTPGRGLQGPPRAEMAPPGTGTSGSKHAQGASASWGCVPVPPTLRPRFSGPRLGSGGLACHKCSYARVHTRLRLGCFLLVVPTSHLARPCTPRSGRETYPRGARVPQPSVSWVSLPALLGPQGSLRKTRAMITGPRVRRGGGGPARPRRLPGRDGGESVCPLPLLRCAPPSPLGPGLRPGAVTTPFLARHFLSSPLGLPGPNRTPLSWSPTKPSPFLPRALRPVRSVPGTSLLEKG